MPNIELTENLRNTIRDLRKQKRKRGDELSKELGKGASYISQLESGKIKEIDFDILDNIFRKITDLPDSQYTEYMNNIIDSTTSHMKPEEVQDEKWMHQYNHEIRKFPITDSLVSYIKEHLENLGYTALDFVEIINQNRGLGEKNNLEPNKLQIEIMDHGNGSYHIASSIRFEFQPDYIENILSGKIKTINYINMKGILYNLFLSEDLDEKEIQEKTDKILKENGFLTIKERNKLIHQKIKEKTEKNETFTFYDVQPTDFDKKYVSIKKDIDDGFDALRDQNLMYSLERMEQLQKNMRDDLGFAIAIMSSPFHKISKDFKKNFWNEYKELLNKYTKQSNPPKKDNHYE